MYGVQSACPELLFLCRCCLHYCRLLLGLSGELECGAYRLAVSGSCLLEHMRVHIQRGAYLAVSHIGRYRNHIDSLEYQQTCVQVYMPLAEPQLHGGSTAACRTLNRTLPGIDRTYPEPI